MARNIFTKIQFVVSMIQLVLIIISVTCGSIYISDAESDNSDISMPILKRSRIPVWTSATLILNVLLGILGFFNNSQSCPKCGLDLYQLISNIILCFVYGFVISLYAKCLQRKYYRPFRGLVTFDLGVYVLCYSDKLTGVKKDTGLLATIFTTTILQSVLCFISVVCFCSECCYGNGAANDNSELNDVDTDISIRHLPQQRRHVL